MKSKFYELYNLIMENLLVNKQGSPIKLKPSDEEYNKALSETKDIIEKIVILLKNEFKDSLSDKEKIEYFNKDRLYVIKCPGRIREQIIKKSIFLSDKISKMIDDGILINNNYEIKINDVSQDNEKKANFNEIKNDSDDISFQKTGKSSVGEYNIPVVVQSDENDEDFYKFNIILFAKPNTGAIENREENLSITIAEFVPCLLWNANASEDIDISKIIYLITNFDIKNSEYSVSDKSKQKIQKLVSYFKNVYNSISSKKLIDNKLYGAIGIYKFMRNKFSDFIGNKCIWTDIKALKPEGYKDNPADIMIDKGNGKYISISLKTASREKESPPLKNTTVKEFLDFCNSVTKSDNFNIKTKFYLPLLEFAKNKNIFTDEEVEKLRSLENNSNKMATYINNSDIAEKCLKKGEIRSFAINKLVEIINEAFIDKHVLMDYFLQVQHNDNDFYLLKAIERNGAEPIQITLNYEINDDFKIFGTETDIVILGFTINNVDRKIKIGVRSKGHGLHGYFSYDMVSQLF